MTESDNVKYINYNGEFIQVQIIDENETHQILKTENGKTIFMKKESVFPKKRVYDKKLCK